MTPRTMPYATPAKASKGPLMMVTAKFPEISSTIVTVWFCKRFEYVIRSENNLKTARHKIVNQSENRYDRDNYADC